MNDHSPWRPALLVGCVVLMLLVLFHMPRLRVGDDYLRRVNLLSDVQRTDSAGNVLAEVQLDRRQGIAVAVDTVSQVVSDAAYRDSIPQGMVPIEDFSDTDTPEMEKFYAALSRADRQLVRIAYFGDSFIEGDVMTQDLREMLQTAYGGQGVGFVDIDCASTGFRQTVRASRSGWDHHAATYCDDFKGQLQGLNGRYYLPQGQATYEARCNGYFPDHLTSVSRASVLFTPGPGTRVTGSVNGGGAQTLYGGERAGSAGFACCSLTGDIRSFRFTTVGSAARFYGVALEGNRGVVLDNFSLRANPGFNLSGISDDVLQGWGRERPYHLIVIQYGLAVANAGMRNYPSYKKTMSQIIRRLKTAFPEASILIHGMPDRDGRDAHGQLVAVKGVKELVQLQRQMAQEEHVAFWSLFDAMGGSGSLAKMTAAGEAAKDYCHINFKGGKRVAGIIFDVWRNGRENYDRRCARGLTGRSSTPKSSG